MANKRTTFMIAMVTAFVAVSMAAEDVTTDGFSGYKKNVLLELCQYKGVGFVRDPEDPACRYIACWDRHPYHMPCPLGMTVPTSFFWGDTYPCTDRDYSDSCSVTRHVRRDHDVQATPDHRPRPRDDVTQRARHEGSHGYDRDDADAGRDVHFTRDYADTYHERDLDARDAQRGRMETLHGLGGEGSTGDSYYSATYYVDEATGNRRRLEGAGRDRPRPQGGSSGDSATRRDRPRPQGGSSGDQGTRRHLSTRRPLHSHPADIPSRATGSFTHVPSRKRYESRDTASTDPNNYVTVTGKEVDVTDF